jgi:RimJ/RimL family protein N-acetyltransferase
VGTSRGKGELRYDRDLAIMTVSVVPRLTTQRLLLRQPQLADFPGYAEHMADPVAMTHMSGVRDQRTAWRLFGALAGTWALTGAGWWVIELGATGECVGIVGAFFRETQLFDPALKKPSAIELGWSVYRQYWRCGYAREAASAALSYGLANYDVERAIAHTAPDNAASIRVAQSIGMRFEGEVDFYGESSRRYVRERAATP